MNGCHIKPEQFFNLIFGYNAQYVDYSTDLNAPAGTVTKTGSVVPAGEIWVVTHSWCINNTRGAVNMLLLAMIGGNYHRLNTGAPAAGIGLYWDSLCVLMAGDYLGWQFLSTILNDDLYWGASGYKMKIA